MKMINLDWINVLYLNYRVNYQLLYIHHKIHPSRIINISLQSLDPSGKEPITESKYINRIAF